jgi:hypothetical protein
VLCALVCSVTASDFLLCRFFSACSAVYPILPGICQLRVMLETSCQTPTTSPLFIPSRISILYLPMTEFSDTNSLCHGKNHSFSPFVYCVTLLYMKKYISCRLSFLPVFSRLNSTIFNRPAKELVRAEKVNRKSNGCKTIKKPVAKEHAIPQSRRANIVKGRQTLEMRFKNQAIKSITLSSPSLQTQFCVVYCLWTGRSERYPR